MTVWIGAALALAGVAGLGYSVIVYVANRRNPHVDQMGTSIEFDRAWITAAIVASFGAVLLFRLPWSWAFGFTVIAYIAIIPVKLVLRRLFIPPRR
ncbi:hypothetical protein BH23GEM10_BH23GEM10_17740 [soil metagenome]